MRKLSSSFLEILPCLELTRAMVAARTARSSILNPAVSASVRVGGSLNLRRKRVESSVPSGPGTWCTSRPRGFRSSERTSRIFL